MVSIIRHRCVIGTDVRSTYLSLGKSYKHNLLQYRYGYSSQSFTPRQHLNKLSDPLHLRLFPLNATQAKQKGKPLRPAQPLPSRPRPRIRLQRRQEIRLRLRGAHAIRSLPPSIGPGPIDLRLSPRAHAARADEPLDMPPVDLRPPAAGAPRGEGLCGVVIVMAAALAVDPAEAEGYVEGFRVCDARGGGFGFAQQKADACVWWVRVEVGLPLCDCEGADKRLVGVSDHSTDGESWDEMAWGCGPSCEEDAGLSPSDGRCDEWGGGRGQPQ